MALKPHELKAVEKLIDERIQAASDPTGWKKWRQTLPVAVFVGLLGLTSAGWYYAFSRAGKDGEFQGRTTSDLATIRDAQSQSSKTLGDLQSRVTLLEVRASVQKYSSVAPKDLKPYRNDLNLLKNHLAKSEQTTPGFWPASFEVITLLSKAISYVNNPHPSESVVRDANGGVHVQNPGDILRLEGLIKDCVFEEAVIRFDPNVRLVNVVFKNCVFIFPEVGLNPPKSLQNIGEILLASDLSSVTVKGS